MHCIRIGFALIFTLDKRSHALSWARVTPGRRMQTPASSRLHPLLQALGRDIWPSKLYKPSLQIRVRQSFQTFQTYWKATLSDEGAGSHSSHWLRGINEFRSDIINSWKYCYWFARVSITTSSLQLIEKGLLKIEWWNTFIFYQLQHYIRIIEMWKLQSPTGEVRMNTISD